MIEPAEKYYYCPHCELIFIKEDYIPSPQEEKKRYEEHNNTPENRGYVQMFENFMGKVINPYQDDIETVLDFGCGPEPVLARILGKRGFTVDIYDPCFFRKRYLKGKPYFPARFFSKKESILMKSLLIVDLQNDFCPGGKLAVPDGDKIVPVVNQLMDKFSPVVASKDWHPEGSTHFEKWPVHCLRESRGAELHSELENEKIDKIFLKGTGDRDDGYSAFEATNCDLQKFLLDNNVDEVYITGLATEYCVKETALEAVKRGFKVYVVEEGVAGINKEDIKKAVAEMKEKGINFVSFPSI